MASGSKKVVIAALIGNGLVAITKFVASIMTGSSAMFSEAIHSIVDSGNQILLLFGLKQSEKPASEDFPFGHGKEVYFWSFVVAILIFSAGAGISIYEGIHHLMDPSPIENVLVNYIVLTLALLFEGGAWYMAWKEFEHTRGKNSLFQAVHQAKDPSIFVVFFEDSAAILGLIVALIGITLGHLTGNPLYDGIASILIGCILAGTATWLAYETKSLLIGESAKPATRQGIRKLLTNQPHVEHVNEIATMHMGPNFILATISLDFEDQTPAGIVEKTIAQLDCQIKTQYPLVKRVFIEVKSRKDMTSDDNLLNS
ncbi:cation diffusion facilitator family transporter [Zooshikella harenae]|uniref:Cation transporter n=1 Tax=Zooshikella harenae TaxID=2827238 RepID=A0ABS5Z9D4_9GAMM|nr:cation diffusion facilitator family transporter [Zooshikella harenae]MBU2710659.1 cation transporter [Zooshikella harenae]